MPGDSYIQLPDNSYIHLTGDETPDQLNALRTKLGGMQNASANPRAVRPDPLTQQTNAAAAAARGKGIIAPTPLPGAGRTIMGTTWPSPLDASSNFQPGLAPGEQPLGSPIAPPFASIPKAIGAVAGGYGGSKLAEYGGQKLGADQFYLPWLRDIGGLAGTMAGGGSAGQLEDAYPAIKNFLGKNLRTAPTVESTNPSTGTLGRAKSVNTLNPIVKGIANLAKVVGGPQIANALIPDYPEPIGPFRRVSTGPIPSPNLPFLPASAEAEAQATSGSRPITPLIGTPEEWAASDQQMRILQNEAKNAGLYSAARGKVGKPKNYQQRQGRSMSK